MMLGLAMTACVSSRCPSTTPLSEQQETLFGPVLLPLLSQENGGDYTPPPPPKKINRLLSCDHTHKFAVISGKRSKNGSNRGPLISKAQ